MTRRRVRSAGVAGAVAAAALASAVALLGPWGPARTDPARTAPPATAAATSAASTSAASTSAGARASTPSQLDPESGLPVVSLSALPPEARRTVQAIDRGGPFRYSQDGAVFENRERLLPRRPRGYYREYTVSTPGEDDRGPRRLVTGSADELYYTADHYASFVRVRR